jgi:hypothetical protein
MTHRLFIRRSLTATLLWVLAGIFLSAIPSRAQNSAVQQRRMENRFLIVIDTSSAMKSRSDGVEEAVTGLLASNMKGELRKGDTIGLWTYNDRLSTDFPMQVWSEKKQQAILNDVREHIHSLVYEKRAHLEKAWPTIHQIVTGSERLTIILIFDGSDSITGTTFDKDLRKLHKQYAREFRSAHIPFVTVLAAHNGAIFDFTINHPNLVMLPHMADPLPPPPEIIEPQPLVVAPPPTPEVAAPPAHRVEINLTGADFPHPARTPPPTVTNVETAVTPAPAAAVPATLPTPVPAAPAAVPAGQPPATVSANVAPPTDAPSPPSALVTAPSKSAPVAPAPAVLTPAVAATVVPAAPGQRPTMLVIAFSLLTIAVALVVLVWKGRGRSQPSLISKSIDHPR